jgi:hypothetical protein
MDYYAKGRTRMKTISELDMKLMHGIRAWTPGPDYPERTYGIFKEVFHFDNEPYAIIQAYADEIRKQCAGKAIEWFHSFNEDDEKWYEPDSFVSIIFKPSKVEESIRSAIMGKSEVQDQVS